MAGTDYTFANPFTVTFDYDASEMPVPLAIKNKDSEPTADRTILLQLQNPIGGPIVDGKDILEIIITDNGTAYPGNGCDVFQRQHLNYHLTGLHTMDL